MSEHDKAFGSLNKAQLEAVKQIDGPVLVVAGPGTGKTQLIGTRVGHILNSTDTLPRNILLLTFTEAGVDAMRQRLGRFLHQAAYEVNISTYHAFGSEIIRRHPEYFEAGLEPIDELESFTILRGIIGRLPYSNPMKYADAQLADILGFISDAKRALLLPADIAQSAQQNRRQIAALNKEAKSHLDQLGVISQKSLPIFHKLELALGKSLTGNLNLPNGIQPLAKYAHEHLQQALTEVETSGKTTPITLWKNVWLAKDRDGNFIFEGDSQNQKLAAAADVYKKYQDTLKRRRLYDYDDMILRAIDGLEKNPELKYSLAEQYLYIMLDEFQDTNPAQMRLIELLTDHPVLAGRPNLLAVGDDDQAIYAFQGADHANMAEFSRHYKDVKVVSLKENYRSQPAILETAANISAQIAERLQDHLPNTKKGIVAAAPKGAGSQKLEARQFKSDAAQYEWLASEVKRLGQKADIPLSEIAILAPRHRNLMPLLPYLGQQSLPIRYERRDNILETPLVRQLEQMSRLCLALQRNQLELADIFWPEVLSYDFWGLKTEDIWQISWQAREVQKPWTQTLLKTPQTHKIALFFLRLKDLLSLTTLEQQLDLLVGLPEISAEQEMPMSSPFFNYYFGAKAQEGGLGFVELLSQLSTLRRHLLDRQRTGARPLGLADFILFIEEYRAAGLQVLDTNAYSEAEQAVNVMTAHAAKGREFQAVFIIDAQDEVWGSASRTRGQYLSLPANLQFIRYRGASEDEKLRLLYVAITRAKTHLYLTSYSHTLAGKATSQLKYLDIRQTNDGKLRSHVMPASHNLIIQDNKNQVSLEAAQNYWSARHYAPFKPSLRKLLAERLKHYQLSATHVNQFTDVTSGGPQAFLLDCLLHFPKAKTAGAHYGTAVHETIRWFFQKAKRPSSEQVLNYFEDRLSQQRLAPQEHQLFTERGRLSLSAWLAQRGQDASSDSRHEFNFRNEASFIGDAHLSGKIDRLSIDRKKRTIILTDFKTGQPYRRWVGNSIRLHKYRQQLLIYKLLVERSRLFRGYKVEKALLEFVEPDEYGQIVQLELAYEESELEEMKKLLISIWRHVQDLDFPQPDTYAPTIAGIKAFEKQLTAEPK